MVLPSELLSDSAATLRLVGELLDELEEGSAPTAAPELRLDPDSAESASGLILRAYAEVVSLLSALQDGRRTIGRPAAPGRPDHRACPATPAPVPAASQRHLGDAGGPAPTCDQLHEARRLLGELEERFGHVADLLDSGVREMLDAADAA